LVMSTKATAKPKPFPPRLEASAKSKGASLPTRLNDEGVGNAVKGRDERQQRAPLTAFPTQRPRLRFFSLTRTVVVIDVVIDRMTNLVVGAIDFKLPHYPLLVPVVAGAQLSLNW